MKQRILAIDDEPHMLVLLERIIREKTPYEIRTTSNALEVPDLLAEQEYEMIVTDLKMPKLDGLEILKRIRDENRKELVVLITAFGSADTSREARALGVFDYITKPFRKEEILACLQRGMEFQESRDCQRTFNSLLELEDEEAAVREFRHLYQERRQDSVSQES